MVKGLIYDNSCSSGIRTGAAAKGVGQVMTSLRRSVLVGLIVSFAALLGVAPTAAQPPAPVGEDPMQAPPQERAAALARPAIVYIEAKFTANVLSPDGTSFAPLNDDNPWEVNVTCTGFGVNPDGYIATAGHCVDATGPDGIKDDIITQVAKEVHRVEDSIPEEDFRTECLAVCTVQGRVSGSPPDVQISVTGGATGNGSPQAQPARVVDFRPFDQGDVALLKIDATDQPSIELGEAQVQIGTPVLSIGYLEATTGPNREPTNKDGRISSKGPVGENPVPVYETSAAVSTGMSGGPTIGLDGRVLGLNSFKLAKESQPFSYIAPSTELSELLNSNGVRNLLGPNDVAYRQGLVDYFSGRYTKAIANFDKLLAVSPNQPQALQYKTLAVKARDQFGDPGLSVLQWVLIGIAGLLVILVVVTAALLLRRRGRHRQTKAPSLLAPVGLPGVPGGWTPPGPMPGPVPSGPAHAHPVSDWAPNVAPAPMRNETPTAGVGFCSSCATELASSVRFCPHCGAPQG